MQTRVGSISGRLNLCKLSYTQLIDTTGAEDAFIGVGLYVNFPFGCRLCMEVSLRH